MANPMTETAKERKRNREIAEEAEFQRKYEERKNGYPRRFKEALSDALRENFELMRVDPVTGEYILYARNEDEDFPIFDTFDGSPHSEELLENLEVRVAGIIMEAAIRERKIMVRNKALEKLNPEEREALGL